ncbi:MAG: hypothetical protein AAF959_30400, partial [Cyanobacteria bacterium P01_D01_bin.56]
MTDAWVTPYAAKPRLLVQQPHSTELNDLAPLIGVHTTYQQLHTQTDETSLGARGYYALATHPDPNVGRCQELTGPVFMAWAIRLVTVLLHLWLSSLGSAFLLVYLGDQ